MKTIRYVGSLAFVVGLFICIFAGMPWAVVTAEDPVVPFWLRCSVFALLGGILTVLASVAIEQRKTLPSEEAPAVAVEPPPKLLLSNSETVPHREMAAIKGLVQGHTVYAIWLGKDLSALIRLILGGELTEYTDMMGKARAVATERMMAEAEELGANAIINVRYMTTSVVGSAAELLAYGTAVRLV